MDCSVECAICTCGKFTDDAAHYAVVAVVDTDADTDADCEGLFERFNIGDHAGLRVRSLSVGDVVAFESGRCFVCLLAGFGEIEPTVDFLSAVSLPAA